MSDPIGSLAAMMLALIILHVVKWRSQVNDDVARSYYDYSSAPVRDTNWQKRFTGVSTPCELESALGSDNRAERDAAALRLSAIKDLISDEQFAQLGQADRRTFRKALDLHDEFPTLSIAILRRLAIHGDSADLPAIRQLVRGPTWKHVRIAAERSLKSLSDRIEAKSSLLRPSDAVNSTELLLRPAGESNCGATELLLRPVNPLAEQSSTCDEGQVST